MGRLIGFLLAFPLAAQSLSLSCPPPAKFNQPAVCTISATGPASLQFVLTSAPKVNIAISPLVGGKSVSAGANGIYMLIGMNATPLSGNVASVTVPAHSGNVVLTLSQTLGSSGSGHVVQLSPAVSVSVQ